MIKVRIYRDSEGFIWGFEIKGHSGFAECGKDIVCAGISALAYAALGALEQLAGLDCCCKCEEEGHMICNIPNDTQEHLKPLIKIILETVIIGMKQIENSYSEHVLIEEQEV
jgi:hypothetical protein